MIFFIFSTWRPELALAVDAEDLSELSLELPLEPLRFASNHPSLVLKAPLIDKKKLSDDFTKVPLLYLSEAFLQRSE